jgi:hypothetical protein
MIPVIIQEPITWDKISVPHDIVRYCADWTNENPYIINYKDVELKLLDCYWFKMGYYE